MPEAKNKIEVNWDLWDMDHEKLWYPQFPIENVSQTVGGQLADQPRFGFQDAITNWTQGRASVITFETMLFSESEEDGESTRKRKKELEALAIKDDDLGRPPICIFSMGQSISEVCIVEAVDPTIVTTLRNGLPREVRFNISLRRYVPFSQKQIDPTAPVKESFLLIASAAEQSYEAIARRYYGDPLLGDRLRKRHPDYPFAPAVGVVVKVPARAIILQEVVEPASHILSLTDDKAVDAFEVILDERSSRTLTVVK